jgi:hypothetical protein
VQPSGLIFLVIIAIWAAYLLQHWIRRREHLVSARSIDRFSDAMRVLERRSPLAEAAMSMQAPRSYDVSPARPSRPEVVVKHTEPSGPSAGSPQGRAAAPVQSIRTFRVLGGISARRLRGLSLLASLVLFVVVAPLAAFGVLPGWTALLAVAVLVVDLAWLRRAAQVERARRRTASRPVRREREHATQAPQVATVATTDTATAREPHSESAPAAAAESAAGDADGESSPAPQVDTVTGSGWQPVPVPPPTYTLKAKAERPMPVAAPVTESPSAVEESESDSHMSDSHMDDLLHRRRAAGA